MKIGISGVRGFLGQSLEIELNSIAELSQIDGVNKFLVKESELFRFKDCDFFLHLAEPAAREVYEEDFRRVAFENSKILSGFFGNKLVYISSVLVYGLGDSKPHKETDPLQPYDSYTDHKVQVEEQLSINNSRVLRMTNLIGQRMHPNNVFNNLINSMKSSKKISIQIDSERDFLNIQDAARLISSTLQNSFPRVVNIGSGTTKSISQIAKLISSEMNLKAEIDYQRILTDNSKSCVPDISLISSYNPSFIYTPIEESIRLLLSKEAV